MNHLNKKIPLWTSIFIVFIIATSTGLILGIALLPKINRQKTRPISCSAEAKLCPDGSSVARSGPNCEFAECPNEKNLGMANPASVFCKQNGGVLEIITAEDGSQSGICKFNDGSQCDEWQYFRGECQPNDNQKQINASDWQLYKSENMGFTVNIPKTWVEIMPHDGSLTEINKNSFGEYSLISSRDKNEKILFMSKDTGKITLDGINYQQNLIKINNQTVKKITTQVDGDGIPGRFNYDFVDQKLIIIFDKMTENIEKIISSIKFE